MNNEHVVFNFSFDWQIICGWIFARCECKSKLPWNKKYLLFQIYYLASFYVTWRRREMFQVFKYIVNLTQVTPKKVS